MADKKIMAAVVRDYLITCPVLNGAAKVGVNFLGDRPTEYTVDTTPVSPVVKMYADGASLRQYVFIFASKEYYSPDVLENLDLIGFYEQLADWFDAQTKANTLPDLGEGKSAVSIETLTSGYLFDAAEDNARYQIQARLKYYQEF